MKKLLVYIANLSHTIDGRTSSEGIPLNIGFLATYLDSSYPGICEIRLFNIPNQLEDACSERVPDILACSNYMWSFQLNYQYLSYYKLKYPNLLTVMGGPNYPGTKQLQEKFLRTYNLIDFYVFLEGELSFTNLVGKYLDSGLNINRTKQETLDGCHFIVDGNFCESGEGKRLLNLEDIPSPYLGGQFNSMLQNGFAPMLQTNRGCPFACAFCQSANSYYTKIRRFPLDRIKEEVQFIGQHAKSKLLHITDDNFGIFPEDAKVSCSLMEARRQHGWPLKINLSTSKVNYNRVYDAISILGESLYFSVSAQSLNPQTLDSIKRKNLSLVEHKNLLENLKTNKVKSMTELILGLPEESFDSYSKGVESMLDVGVDIVGVYTCMMLPNTPLKEDPYYDQYQLVRKFRIIPGDFGHYLGEPVFEIEEVVVASNTLTFAEYLEARGLFFVVACYYNLGVFEELIKYLKQCNTPITPWIKSLHETIKIDTGLAGNIYRRFIQDTEEELWDTEEQLRDHFSDQENYLDLVSGDRGANLAQKYQALYLLNLSDFSDLIPDSLESCEYLDMSFIEDLIKFSNCSRGDLFENSKQKFIYEFRSDILGWLNSPNNELPAAFSKITDVKFFKEPYQEKILEEYLESYGASVLGKGKILTRINPETLYRKYVLV